MAEDGAPLGGADSRGYFGVVARRFMRHKLGMASLCFLMALILLALLGPLLMPYGPNKLVARA